MSDRKNLIERTQIAAVFLDNGLRIKSFALAITDMFNLIESDYGRPIIDIASRLAYGELGRDVRKVLRTLSRIEQEVALADGSASFMMRILPYHTIDNVIDGAVITFTDITERKRSEEGLARLASIVATSHDAIIGLTLDGTVTTRNAGAQRIYGYTAEETVGQPWAIIMPPDEAGEFRADGAHQALAGRDGRRGAPRGGGWEGAPCRLCRFPDPQRRRQGGRAVGDRARRDRAQAGEERQRMLLAELDHRVKNTLATVLSISSQTLRRGRSLERFREAFEGWLRALAKVHDLLAASDWAGADLRDLCSPSSIPTGPWAIACRSVASRSVSRPMPPSCSAWPSKSLPPTLPSTARSPPIRAMSTAMNCNRMLRVIASRHAALDCRGLAPSSERLPAGRPADQRSAGEE